MPPSTTLPRNRSAHSMTHAGRWMGLTASNTQSCTHVRSRTITLITFFHFFTSTTGAAWPPPPAPLARAQTLTDYPLGLGRTPSHYIFARFAFHFAAHPIGHRTCTDILPFSSLTVARKRTRREAAPLRTCTLMYLHRHRTLLADGHSRTRYLTCKILYF